MNLDTWYGIIAGIITSVVVGYFFWVLSSSFKRLSYSLQQITLIEGGQSTVAKEIKITYNGHQIKELKRCNMIIWNSGKQTIRQEDIVETDRLRVDVGPDKAHFLRAKVIGSTNNTINAHVSESRDKSFLVNFRYLEPRQGFKIEVLYEGDGSAIYPIGTFIGMPKGIEQVKLIEDAFAPLLSIATLVVGIVAIAIIPFSRRWSLYVFVDGGFIILIPLMLTVGILFGKKFDSLYGKWRRRSPPSQLIGNTSTSTL